MRKGNLGQGGIGNQNSKVPLKQRVQIYFVNNPENREMIYTGKMKISEQKNVAM